MKKILYILLLLVATSCSRFLDEVDKDKLIPSKTEHYAALLLNCFKTDYPGQAYTEFMTDNITEYSGAAESLRNPLKPTYTWQIEIEITENGQKLSGTNNCWGLAYKSIAVVNYVFELIDEAIGTEDEKNYIKAEAHFMRGLSYFNLVNVYAKHYNTSTAESDLGVPVRLGIGVEQTYSRNSVADCYRQIEDDLLKSREFFQKTTLKKSKWHPSLDACNLLLSRMYLYMKNWTLAEKYAGEVISNRPITRMTKDFLLDENSKELIYTASTYPKPLSQDYFTSNGWRVNSSLINMFNENDVRKEVFFIKKEGVLGVTYEQFTKKMDRSYTVVGVYNMRVSEAYLIRAEARNEMNNTTGAVADMTTLLSNRYLPGTSFTVPETKSQLKDFIINERRKELCFEDHHRWFDLKRMDNRPKIVHYFTITDLLGQVHGKQAYTLFSDDPNYILPIPIDERNNNPLIYNNERMDKIPETTDVIIFD